MAVPRIRIRRSSGLAVVLLAGMGLLACRDAGPPTVSLDEAKKITAEFKNQSLTPPPKSIDDVLRDTAKFDLSSKPPCDVVRDMDEAYRKEVMRGSQVAVDVRETSLQLAHRAWQNFARGNYGESVELQRLAIDMWQQLGRAGGDAMLYAALAVYHAYAANYPEARRAISTAYEYEIRVRPERWQGTEQSFKKFRFLMKLGQGVLAEARDSLVGAEAYYREALSQEQLFRTNWPDVTRLALAKNLLRQGRLQEAELVARDAWDKLRHEYYAFGSGLTVFSILTLGEILFEEGRYDDAAKVVTHAIEMAKADCARPESLLLSEARDILGRSLAAEGRWREASAVYETLRDAMARDQKSFERLYRGSLSWALASLRLGEVGEAGERLAAALRQANDRYGAQSYRSAEVRAFVAMAKLAGGEKAAALTEFEAAVPILLDRRTEAEAESTTLLDRDRRLKAVLDDYIGLLVDIRDSDLERDAGIDALSEAFRLAELARSQGVDRAMSASGARVRLPDPALADMARREQDAGKQISALQATLGKLLGREGDRDLIADLRSKIGQLQSARRALREEIENKFPTYAELTNPKPLSIDRARAALRRGEALIVTYVGDDRTFVWAVPRSGEAAFAVAPHGRARIAAVVRDLRRALDPNARTIGDIPAFDVELSHRLYRTLLAPVAAGWQDAESLLVVAHGALGQLPFSVLVTKPARLGKEKAPLFADYRAVPWLARSHAVTVLPSVSSLTTLRALPPAAPSRRDFAGFGDPVFDASRSAAAKPAPAAALASRGLITVRGLPLNLRAVPKLDGVSSADLAKLPPLPDTADEIRGMALAMNADLTRDVFTGRAATESQVKTMTLSGYKVLAFATHGLVPGDLDGLTQPALALSSPAAVGGGEDGLLTMGEILGLRLDADWVVLSACNTAAGRGKGAEAISGLGRAFFYAGTRALLVSNWPVETISAKRLTTDLFRRQAANPALTRADALRLSMLNLMDGPGFVDDKGRSVFAYAHPIFWAPFSLVGDGGGGTPGT